MISVDSIEHVGGMWVATARKERPGGFDLLQFGRADRSEAHAALMFAVQPILEKDRAERSAEEGLNDGN
jgi:hypothetical protein